MKTMEDIKLLHIGQTIVVPWENLPSPRPEKGAAFGGQGKNFIAEPKEEGLEVRCVHLKEALEWKNKQ